MTYYQFAKIIKKKRIEKKLLQKEVAFYLTISEVKYSRIENGIQEPTFIELQNIAILLDIDLTNTLELKERKSHIIYYD